MADSAYSPKSRKTISRHIKKHKDQGMPQDQAVAAAMSEARRKGQKVPSRKATKKRGGAKKSAKKSGASR